jgi:hypothetical protein
MKYRKKPVIVEVHHYLGDPERGHPDWLDFPEWLIEAIKVGTVYHMDEADTLYIKTLEGVMSVSKGDYIIQGVKGEIYPCKPDIFEMTYEIVVQ